MPTSNRGQVTEREGSVPCFLAENKIRQNKILQGRCCGGKEIVYCGENKIVYGNS